MRMFRILSCAVVLQMLWMLAGCCGEVITINYEWSGMTLRYLDNSGPAIEESDSSQLPARAYGIRMRLEPHVSVASLFSIIPVARATSCIEDYTYIIRDSVRAIHIHSLSAGSAPREVTGDFMVQKSPLQGIASFITVPELIERMNEHSPALWTWVDLIRTEGTEEPGPLRFIVTMEHASGKTLTDTTNPVTLL